MRMRRRINIRITRVQILFPSLVRLLGCRFYLDKCVVFCVPLAQLLLVALLLVLVLHALEVLEEGFEVDSTLILDGEFVGLCRG